MKPTIAVCAMLAFCLGPFATQNCAAQEMATIEKYIEQNQNNRNPTAFRFVFLRCYTLFLMVGNAAENNPDPRFKAVGKIHHGAADKFFDALYGIKPYDKQYMENQAKIMATAYAERWDRAKALTGNSNDDPIIASDAKTCWALIKSGRV
jgi:hypothetical protein